MRRFAAVFSLSLCVVAGACEPKAAEPVEGRSEGNRGSKQDGDAPAKANVDEDAFSLTLTCVTQGAPVPKRTISVESQRGAAGTVRRSEDGLGIDAAVSDSELAGLYEAVEGASFQAFTDANPEDTAAPTLGTDCSLALTTAGRTVNKQYSNRQEFSGDAENGRRALHKALGELEGVMLSKNRDPSMDPQGADPETITEPPT